MNKDEFVRDFPSWLFFMGCECIKLFKAVTGEKIKIYLIENERKLGFMHTLLCTADIGVDKFRIKSYCEA